VRGDGTITSFFIVNAGDRRGPTAPPYCVVHVELDDGPRYLANLLRTPLSEVRIGMRVRMILERHADGRLLPQFETAGG
jgi:uncharacterized OB-fold protein